jgi:hypothetical protein
MRAGTRSTPRIDVAIGVVDSDPGKQCSPDQASRGFAILNTESDEEVTDADDGPVSDIFSRCNPCILGSNATDFEAQKAGLHEENQRGSDNYPQSIQRLLRRVDRRATSWCCIGGARRAEKK